MNRLSAKLLLSALVASAYFNNIAAEEVQYPFHLRYLKACRFDNGIEMPMDECELLRKTYADELLKQRQAKRWYEQVVAESEAADARAKAKTEADRKTAEAARRAVIDEEARKEQERVATEQRLEREEQRRVTAEVAKMKSKCGNDYKNPTIGMSIDRVRQCVVGGLTVAGQINRADGVLTTYVTSGGAFFHVIDGKVIAWGR